MLLPLAGYHPGTDGEAGQAVDDIHPHHQLYAGQPRLAWFHVGPTVRPERGRRGIHLALIIGRAPGPARGLPAAQASGSLRRRTTMWSRTPAKPKTARIWFSRYRSYEKWSRSGSLTKRTTVGLGELAWVA